MVFKSQKYVTTSRMLIVILAIALTVSGCAVLTRSQVAEVREFAKATQGFSGLPGSVIKAYGEVREGGMMLKLATNTYVDKKGAEGAWDNMLHSREFSKELTIQAEKLHKALEILDTYADLLLMLSSDDYTVALDRSAAQLGNQLDKGVKVYNETYEKEFRLIGAYAAAIARGAGGIYLRKRQARLLRLYVQEADDMIKELTQDVESLLDPFMTNSGGVEGHLQAELKELKNLFIVEAVQSRRNLQLSTLRSVAEMIANIEDAKKLARVCKKSAVNYRSAHSKLKQAITKKRTLKERIEEIQSLIDEIRAANELRKSLER